MLQHIKCVVVGDSVSDKTGLCEAFAKGSNEIFSSEVTIDGRKIIIDVVDTTTLEQTDSVGLLPFAYHEADVFLLCFSITSKKSLDDLKTIWWPETRKNAKDVPNILVGTGKELREAGTKKSVEVSVEEARQSLDDTESWSYFECSTASKEGVEQVFYEAGRVGLEGRSKVRRDSFLSSITKGITGLFDKPKGDGKARDLPPLEKKTSYASLRGPLNVFLASSTSTSTSSTSASATSPPPSTDHIKTPFPVKGLPIEKMTGDQVLTWLSTPDFEFAQPYLQAFKSHGVNGALLADLSQEDMEQELGIASRLIRKRLSQEIDNLKKNGYVPSSLPSSSSSFPSSSSSLPSSPSSFPSSASSVTKSSPPGAQGPVDT